MIQKCGKELYERTSLHAQEAAPYENAATIKQPSDDVATEQSDVSPPIAHIDGCVLAKALSDTAAFMLVAQQSSGFLVASIHRPILGMRVLRHGAIVRSHVVRVRAGWAVGFDSINSAAAGIAGFSAGRSAALPGAAFVQVRESERGKTLGQPPQITQESRSFRPYSIKLETALSGRKVIDRVR